MNQSTHILTTLLVLSASGLAMAKGPNLSKGNFSRGFSKGSMSQKGNISRAPVSRLQTSRSSFKPSVSRQSNQRPQTTPKFKPSTRQSFQPSKRPSVSNRFPQFKPGISKPAVMPKPNVSNRLPSLRPGKLTPGIKPGQIKPGTIKPGVMRPGVIKPGIIKPGVIKPGVIKPGVIKPTVPHVKPLGPLKPLKPNLNGPKPLRPDVGKIPGLVPGLVPGRPNNTPPANNDDHDDHHHRPNLGGLLNLIKPICLPPIVHCPPPRVCPPCVRAICPQADVIVIEQTTEQILVDFLAEPTQPEFVIDLFVNTEVSLEVDGLIEAPGALVLDVNGIGLPIEILGSEAGLVNIKVPSVGLSESQLGKLYVLNADLQLVAAIDARLNALPDDASVQVD